MPRFTAKPITIEAVRFNGDIAPWPEPFRRAVLRHLPGGITEIATGDGPRPCRSSDWVTLGPAGFSVIHAAPFEAMFSLVSPNPHLEAFDATFAPAAERETPARRAQPKK